LATPRDRLPPAPGPCAARPADRSRTRARRPEGATWSSERLPDAEVIFPSVLASAVECLRTYLEAEVQPQRSERRVVAQAEARRRAQPREIHVGGPREHVAPVEECHRAQIASEQPRQDAPHLDVQHHDAIAAA